MAKKKATTKAWHEQWKEYAHWLIAGSILAVILASVGYMGVDIWLASTQWLLVAAVLAALGVYAKLESK
ncbi:hypothetical protein HY404_02815 [Candidatus Microgenomates bacterium]|nr:hypothetical protein [Candidatus Microgenomates bacterium]